MDAILMMVFVKIKYAQIPVANAPIVMMEWSVQIMQIVSGILYYHHVKKHLV